MSCSTAGRVDPVTSKHKTAGEFADEFISNPRRLAIAHILFGFIAAFAYWARPGTFTPRLPVFVHRDVTPILLTFVAWCPYVISATVSRRVLGVRDKKATILFIVLATAITATSVVMYLDLIAIKQLVSPIVVSVGVAVALLSACGLSAFIWPNDAPE
jgi:hypothetical protein